MRAREGSNRACLTGCFRDETACSVCRLFTLVLGPGPGAPRTVVGMGPVTVMGPSFRGSNATPASWVTLGPQFAMKPAADRAKLERIASAMADFL